jgi:hypothetical protein
MNNNQKRKRILRSALGLSAVAAVVGSVAFAGVAGAASAGGNYTVNNVPAANNLIVGGGSATTYNLMQSLDTLYNDAPGCTIAVDFVAANGGVTHVDGSGTPGDSVLPDLDYHCLTATEASDGHNLGAIIVDPSTGIVSADGLKTSAGVEILPANAFNDAVVEEAPLGSSNGVFQLESQGGDAGGIDYKYAGTSSINVANNINFARSSRVSSETNLGGQVAGSGDSAGLTFVAYALDGVDWVHYSRVGGALTNSDLNYYPGGVAQPYTTKSQLSEADLEGIYAGDITNWDQLGGANAPILVFSAQEGSGTQSTWKTYVGNNSLDPSKLGTKVNCFNTTGEVYHTVSNNSNGETGVSASQCSGPFDIFENEQGSINVSSLPAQYTDPTLTFTGITTTGTGSATTYTQTVTQSKLVSAGILTALTPPTACGEWTFGCKAGVLHSTTTGSGTGATKNYTQVFTYGVPTQTTVQSDAVFFYSVGLYEHQCTSSAVTAALKAGCAGGDYYATSAKKTDLQLGQVGGTDNAVTGSGGQTGITNLTSSCVSSGSIAVPCLPTEASIEAEAFTIWRPVSNVYSNGTNPALSAATPATVAYTGETGFLCTPRTLSLVNPVTTDTYRTDIVNSILGAGFFPISGSYLTNGTFTGTTDEGAEATSTGAGNGPDYTIAAGTRYAPYVSETQMPDGTSIPSADGSGTATNGDPNGFCLVSNTDASSVG